jgi:predicted enzyme related to lactoylglutathione lyase
MPHVTGIGGVFFRSKGNHEKLAAWYREHLGLKLEPWGGAIFRWPEDPGAGKGATAWQIHEKDSDWFGPSESGFAINYRVHDLEGMIANFRKAGIKLVRELEISEHGNFAAVLDPEGNKVELWEPKS